MTAPLALVPTRLSDGLEAALQRAIASKDPSQAYARDVIQQAAAARTSEALAASKRLKAAFPDVDCTNRGGQWWTLVREARADLNAEIDDTPSGLICNDKGQPIVGYENAVVYLSTSPDWEGVLGYNEFSGSHEILKPPPPPCLGHPGEEIKDHLDVGATRWLERKSGKAFHKDVVASALDAISRENGFHPVRDRLRSLPSWDRVPRLNHWLYDYAGVDRGSDEKPNTYAAWAGRKYLISAVARIMQPGCQADHVLVLEGNTGIGKSTLCRTLSMGWFDDHLDDMHSKDAMMKVRGVWMVELKELDVVLRSERNAETTVKSFIDRRHDRYRAVYGRREETTPRQCVFIGTTERSDWLRAETGRRWWPVKCGVIDIPGLVRDLDQLWAEAVAAYDSGELWYPTGAEEIAEATLEQSARHDEDVLTQPALDKAEDLALNEGWFTTHMVLHAMLVPLAQQPGLKQRIDTILRRAGYIKRQGSKKPARGTYGWVKADYTD